MTYLHQISMRIQWPKFQQNEMRARAWVDQSWHFLSFVCVGQHISIKCNQSVIRSRWCFHRLFGMLDHLKLIDTMNWGMVLLGAELGVYDEKAEVVMGPMRAPYGAHAPLPCNNHRTNLDCCFFACHRKQSNQHIVIHAFLVILPHSLICSFDRLKQQLRRGSVYYLSRPRSFKLGWLSLVPDVL